MERKRKATSFLSSWKERKNHKPLVIEGLRQVGKSYTALSFARSHYENVLYSLSPEKK